MQGKVWTLGSWISCFTLIPGAFSQSTPLQRPALCTATAASRFLDQSTFGPTQADIQNVEQVGIPAYLKSQFSLKVTILPQFPMPLPATCDSQETCWGSVWWKAALTGPDQIRQRVAFALSHIFVASTDVVGGYAMVSYYNLLINDAFSNWRTLMQDVTLSPVMGIYLNMANSGLAPAGQIANENFARENLQLFNLGVNLLNQDGTTRQDSAGNPIPTYSQAQVQAFARAFTGWTYPSGQSGPATAFNGGQNIFSAPMLPVEAEHDMQPKVLLDNVTLPGGQTAESDLKGALDNIFQHPNLPPFVSRQLIQSLVTSNPSRSYVARVAAVFSNNGFGVRGDLKAVVQAILLDPEARLGDLGEMPQGGHLREPLLFMASVLRVVPFTPNDHTDNWGYWALSLAASPAGESPMQAPSVFGYFPSNYTIPGTALNGPEFGLENVASVSSRKVLVDRLLSGNVLNMTSTLPTANGFQTLAADPDKLVNAISSLFMDDRMPRRMKQVIVQAITPLSDPGQRVRIALHITLTSSQYKILH